MAKPADTQCRALIDGERCENRISFSEEGDYWSSFCAEHDSADEEARASGEPRVERVPRNMEENVEAVGVSTEEE